MKRVKAFSRVVWVLASLAAGSSPAWGQAGPGKPSPAKPETGRPAAGKPVEKSTRPLSEADYRDLAQSISMAVSAKNLAGLNELIDWDEFFKKVATGWAIPESLRRGTFQGFRAGMDKESSITGQLIKNAKEGGSFTFLRARESRGRQVVLFRLVWANGGVNYFEFVPLRSADGRVGISDIYIYAAGEFMSETFHRTLLPIISDQSRSFLDRLLTGEKDLVHDFPQIEHAAALLNQQSPVEALGLLRKMRPETKKQKMVLLLRFRAAQATDNKEYLAAMEDFRKFYPNDPCLDLLLIDSFVLKKDFPGAMKAIDRLDHSVGGDPYLNLLRIGICEAQGDLEGVRRFAQKAVDEEPTLIKGHLTLLGYSLLAQKYELTLARLKVLDQMFQVEFQDLSQVPEYAGFVQSLWYPEWLAYLENKKKTRNQREPQKSAPAPKPGPPAPKPVQPGLAKPGSGA